MKNQVDYHEGELRETNNPMDWLCVVKVFRSSQRKRGFRLHQGRSVLLLMPMERWSIAWGTSLPDAGGCKYQTIPGGGDLTIDKEGQVFQNGQVVGQVGVFVFENPLLDLQKVGGGFVAKEAETEPQPAEAQQFTIMQGYLESSNVSAIEEMIGLIEVSRAHEANQKMIQTFDQNIGKAIGTLGQTQ